MWQEERGLWEEEIWLRFVDGRPISAIMTQFLEWRGVKLQAMGKRVFILIWGNACWLTSREVKNWIQDHNQQVTKMGQSVRIFVYPLPVKNPWLNPIELK